MNDVKLRAALHSDPAQVSVARRLLRQELAGWGVQGDPEDVALLLLSELVTNAIVHARPPVVMVASCLSGRLRVEVHDGDPASAPRLRRTRDETGEGERSHGRGLRLVAALSTRWGTGPSEGGKAVWFELDAHS